MMSQDTVLLSESFKQFERDFCAQFEFLFRDYGFQVTWRGYSPRGMSVWCLGLDSSLMQTRIGVLGGERGEGIAIGPPSAEFKHSDSFIDKSPWIGLYGATNLVREKHGLNPVRPRKWGEPRSNPLPFGDLPRFLEPVFDEVLEVVKYSSG
jgi:hypothetical protein